MTKKKSILIVFPDEWLQYSPSVLNLYKCCEENHYTKLVYIDNGKFNNEGLVSNYVNIKISKTAAYFWRKTIGYKFYKVLRLFITLLFIKLFDRKYDTIIAIDSSGYMVTKLFFNKTVYFSLETEKDIFFKICHKLGIENLIIQSKERKDYLIGEDESIKVNYIQNSPILNPEIKRHTGFKDKKILYMGNIEFGYGLEHFIESIKDLNDEYTLTLKGIKNDKFYNLIIEKYKDIINSGKLIFDFEYVEQNKIIEYVSKFYIGITGYDIKLAKKSFNYFSSPAGKLFNYYAAGVPVIGIDIIGLKSVKDFNTGILIESVTPNNIINAIQNIEIDYDTHSKNCLKASEEFDFKKGFNKFINDRDDNNTKFSIKKFINQGHERSVKTKKNIVTSIIIKAISISISFLLIPLALDYLNPTKYGIWLTINSVIGWFVFFDIGLGNGLRNKLAEALAKNNKELARTYISTAYVVLSLIIGTVYCIFLFIFKYINWGKLLNTPVEMNEEITKIIFIVFSFFSLQFIVKLITMILNANQRSAISGGINTFASLLSLIIIYILTKTTHSSLLWLSIGVSSANIISPLIVTIWFFSKDYKHLRPSLKYANFKSAKDLMGIGVLFFVMQFAALILFATDNIIIEQLYGPKEVTPYNLAFKYFSIITMGFAIITTPFWSAYTDAYHKNDFEWIKRITNKLTKFWIGLVILAIVMVLLSGMFYHFWIGDKIEIPLLLSISMAFWMLISTWTSIFGNFLSGVGIIRLSLYHSLIMIVVNIPLCIFLAKYLNLGSVGVILGTCLCMLPQVFLHPIQYKKIITKTAKGIWAK